jgi:hypothetical protein
MRHGYLLLGVVPLVPPLDCADSKDRDVHAAPNAVNGLAGGGHGRDALPAIDKGSPHVP